MPNVSTFIEVSSMLWHTGGGGAEPTNNVHLNRACKNDDQSTHAAQEGPPFMTVA